MRMHKGIPAMSQLFQFILLFSKISFNEIYGAGDINRYQSAEDAQEDIERNGIHAPAFTGNEYELARVDDL